MYLHQYLLAALASRLVVLDSNGNSFWAEKGIVACPGLVFSWKGREKRGRMSPLLERIDLYAGPAATEAVTHQN